MDIPKNIILLFFLIVFGLTIALYLATLANNASNKEFKKFHESDSNKNKNKSIDMTTYKPYPVSQSNKDIVNVTLKPTISPIRNWLYPEEDLSGQNYPSVFCLIKTHPNNIKINKSLNVYRVWGHKCDNYRFVTLLPENLRTKDINETYEAFENIHMIQPKSLKREDHADLTLKLYEAMVYVYNKFQSYDWYYIVDDDAYVNVRNLKEFLKDKPSNVSITYGYNFKVIVPGGYHSGGPGYVLSNKAFTSISKPMSENIKNCPDTGIDDVDISACVRKFGGIMGNSTDEKGRERFLVLSLMDHFQGNFPNWLYDYAQTPVKKGLECCADNIIGVHYMSPREVFRLDVAIQVHENVLKLYDDYIKLGKNVTFKNVIKNYILLEDIESDSNRFKELINF